jgi:dipeptidyl aminopeptidase/acylaminoacyl peptidase
MHLIVDWPTGDYFPLIPPKAVSVGARDYVRRYFAFQSSDGLPLSGFVTVPVGVERPPLVLFLEGVEMATAWNNADLVRYLASQGYAVAEVNARGTVLFNRAFVDAGLFQRAKRIPQDLLEAAQHLDRQGWIDGGCLAIYAIGSHSFVG